MRIGIQVSSLKKYLQSEADVASSFEKLAAMGYTDVQIQWVGKSVPYEFIAGEIHKNNFVCWGTQDYYDLVCARMDDELRIGRLYGSRYICVSGIPERFRSVDGVKQMAEELNALTARLGKEGYILTFHPRVEEYRCIPGFDAVGYLMDSVPEMQLTLDCFHTEKSGTDTAGMLRKYMGRTDIVHFKNHKSGQLCPLADGEIDYKPIFAVCAETGVKVVLTEQEAWQKDAFLCMEENLRYLKGIAEEIGVGVEGNP